jgi:Flp pilus assembly protein TadD
MEYLRTNNLAQALEYIKQAAVICPNDPLLHNELGAVYYKQKEYAKAIDTFTQALNLFKHLPEVSGFSTLGNALIFVVPYALLCMCVCHRV